MAGGAAAFGYIKRRWPDFAPTLAYGSLGVIVVAILLFTFTGRGLFTKSIPPAVTVDNVEQNLKKWVEDLGMMIGPAGEPDTYFAHTVSSPNGIPLEIFRSSKEKSGYLQMKTIITVAPEHQVALAKMSTDQVQRVMDELDIEVGRTGAGCTLIALTSPADKDHPSTLTAIGIQRGIPIDNLNEWNFSENFDQVTRIAESVKASLRLAIAAQQTKVK